jgi:pimeloyl-ACP methyl ester carboxylesterase
MVRFALGRASLRRAILAVAIAAPAAVGWTDTASAQSDPPGPSVPQLAWEGCDTGFECATARVPLDYDDPSGPTVSLALLRSPATDPTRRIGSLFVNPGGPGGSGVEAVRGLAPTALAQLNQRFDIIGFDPRGVGGSQQVVCLLPAERALVARWQPTSEQEALIFQVIAKAFEQYRCLANNPILAHLSTANVARDLDLLRQAVGDDKLSYLGFSYGTYLGATYSSLFPGRARALVLDAAIDPTRYANDPYGTWLGYAGAIETALGRFFAFCDRAPECPIAEGGAQANWDRTVAELDREPVLTTFGSELVPITGTDLRTLTFQALYQRQSWPLLAALTAELDAGETGLIDLILASLAGAEPNNSLQAILAVDQPWPTTVGEALAYNGWEASASPRLADVNGLDALDYVFWRVDDTDFFQGPFTNPAGATPALVIGTTFDPATPYEWSEALTDQLGNARLLTSDGDGHTAFGRSGPCIDDAVNAYLTELLLPAEGTVCVQDPDYVPGRGVPNGAAPAPGDTDALSDTTDPMVALASAAVREALLGRR